MESQVEKMYKNAGIEKYYCSFESSDGNEIAMGIMDDDIDEGSAYYDAGQIINKINEVLK